jgi:hypothetical protein
LAATPHPDPFQRLSWLDRRRWSRSARRVVRQFEAEMLADLQALAGDGVQLEWVSDRPKKGSDPARAQAGGAGLAGPVEFSAGGKRVVAAAVWAPAWESLVGAWRGAAVTLAGAGRYHRSWVLRFKVAAGPHGGVARELVLLASRVRLIDHWGGSFADAGGVGLPGAPLPIA